MADKRPTLESLVTEGRKCLSSDGEPTYDHRNFVYWVDRVSEWLDEQFPGSGQSAHWSALPMSRLVVGRHYDPSDEARIHFRQTVGGRLKWLSGVRRPLKADMKESDALFATIDTLIKASLLPQQVKKVVCSDLAEAQRAYGAEAYKASVIMLGAALEGIMMGTLQRSDVIAHLQTSAMAPGPIRRIGNRDPALSDKIGNVLTFEDYKVCIHELIPGSDALGVDNIQSFRNAIHPWKAIQEPHQFGEFDRARAIHYLGSLQKIVEALQWKLPLHNAL